MVGLVKFLTPSMTAVGTRAIAGGISSFTFSVFKLLIESLYYKRTIEFTKEDKAQIITATILGISGGYFLGRVDVKMNGIARPPNAWEIGFDHKGAPHLIAIGPELVEKTMAGVPIISTYGAGVSIVKKLITEAIF